MSAKVGNDEFMKSLSAKKEVLISTGFVKGEYFNSDEKILNGLSKHFFFLRTKVLDGKKVQIFAKEI